MQTKFSLDQETIVKILKGALIAGTGAAALFILNAIKSMQIDNVALVGLVAWFVPFAVNFVKEWMRGETKE